MSSLSTPPVRKGLKPEEVRYLALEGGGGKGFAYVGALQLMQERKILSQLRGVAGTSAGAITALMLSIGMTADEIENELKTTNFDKFFDAAIPRLFPDPCVDPNVECKYLEIKTDNDFERNILALALDPKTLAEAGSAIQSRANRSGPGHLFGWLAYGVLTSMKLGSAVRELAQSFYDADVLEKGPPFTTLLGDLGHYLAYLDRDMGMFCGLAARRYVDNLIATRAAKKAGGNPDQYRNMPFVRHKEIFGTELLVCGANLSTFKTVLFSARKVHTPYFPVADAVRISMSLPIIYKPYVITKHVPGWPVCGTYVDGGIWNNIPLREIEPQPTKRGAPWPSQTLALRLEIDVPKAVESSNDVVRALLGNIIGAGETQVLNELRPSTVELATEPLSLLKFSPSPDVAELIRKRSRRAVSRYFGWDIQLQDMDAKDDADVERMRNRDVCSSDE